MGAGRRRKAGGGYTLLARAEAATVPADGEEHHRAADADDRVAQRPAAERPDHLGMVQE